MFHKRLQRILLICFDILVENFLELILYAQVIKIS
jgi:hypothetical protein